MAVIEKRPISMAEVASLVGDSERGKAIKTFMKPFNILPIEKAEELKKELIELDILKLKETHIVKIIDFLPKNASQLNKVTSDISLNQEEITKIVDVVTKY